MSSDFHEEKIRGLKLLVLDVDETLIYTTHETLPNERKIGFVLIYGRAFHVYARPYLDEFLNWAFSNFDVGIWTASDKEYAKSIIGLILKPSQIPIFIFSGEKCNRQMCAPDSEFDYFRNDNIIKVKDLKKVYRKHPQYSKSRTLVVDDTRTTYSRNYGNAILVKSYTGGPDDDLKLLIKYLEKLLLDTRPWNRIEKREWRIHL